MSIHWAAAWDLFWMPVMALAAGLTLSLVANWLRR